MIAHRGVSGLERENTCAAFVAAGSRSYFGIETDVHQTADGKFIIIHDDTTTRVTGRELTVEETDFDSLRQLRLLDIVNDMPRADLCLPSPEEYISICKKYEKTAVLELKNPMPPETVKAFWTQLPPAATWDHGIEVNVWTVNTPEEAEKLIGMGVDYITSNLLE